MGCCCGSDDDEGKKNGEVEMQNTQDVSDAIDKAHEKATEHCCCCEVAITFLYWTGCKCCCCDTDNIDDYGLDDIVEHRYCTDVPWCIALCMFLIAQMSLFISALQQEADPRWILYYSDWEGNLCAPGEKAGAKAAWPDIRIYDLVICVDSCNETQTDDRIVTPDFSLDFDLDDVDIDFVNGSFTLDVTGYKTTTFFGAYCIPSLETFDAILSSSLAESYSEFSDTFYDTLDELGETVSLAMDDLYTLRWIFFIAAFNCFLVSLLWGFFIRHCGSIMVWCSIGITLFGVVTIGYYMISYSETAYDFGYQTIGDFMYYGGIVLVVADALFFLAICFMWNRIRLAIALAKETTLAMQTMWGLFVYPIVPFVVYILYCVYWLVGALYMASVTETFDKEIPVAAYDPEQAWIGEYTVCDALGCVQADDGLYYYKKYGIEETWQYLLLFHFFVFLWVTQFVVYHTYLVLAGVYAEWYFSEWEDHPEDTKKARGRGKRKLSPTPIINAFMRTTRYHMGTLAIGSLLIAIIEFTEHTLTYFEKKFRQGEPSPLTTAMLCVIKYCLKCMKCILDRINRNGYVIVAITGWPFCQSSMKGISIVFRNIVRSAALGMVSGYLEALGKIAIISFNTGFMLLIIYNAFGDAVSSLFLPTILVLIISWAVCFQYMQLYEVGLNTIFLCFLIDEEVNKSKDFKDENGNVILHPMTGEPIGKMRASHRLYKLIGVKKPKIRAKKADLKRLKSSERIRQGEDKEFNRGKKSLLFGRGDDDDDDDSDSDFTDTRDRDGRNDNLAPPDEMSSKVKSASHTARQSEDDTE